MRPYFLYTVFILLSACVTGDERAETETQPRAPLSKNANSDVFNQSFGKLLEDYFALKDNFVAENESLINEYAAKLIIATDSLVLQELQADSNVVATAKTYTQGISAELKGLLGEKDLNNKRKSFQMIGDQLYDLIRTVQYDRAVIYHNFCPMAFNDQGANWLSNSREIRNPYIPKRMLSCGEIKDSIDFRPR